MPEDNGQSVYTPQALDACEKALRTILTKIGPWGGRIVLIGGMTPRFLVGTVPMDVQEHIGTTDQGIVVKCPPLQVSIKWQFIIVDAPESLSSHTRFSVQSGCTLVYKLVHFRYGQELKSVPYFREIYFSLNVPNLPAFRLSSAMLLIRSRELLIEILRWAER